MFDKRFRVCQTTLEGFNNSCDTKPSKTQLCVALFYRISRTNLLFKS